MSRKSLPECLGRPAPTGRRTAVRVASLCAAAALLAGCAAAKVADDTVGQWTQSALDATGLKKPDPPAPPPVPQLPQAEALRLPRKVPLQVFASPELNHDANDKPLSLVVRVYALRSAAAFEQAPYEAFASGREKDFLGDDVLGMSELTLVPKQHYQAEQKVPRDAAVVGVVALFNAPAPQRWKFTFDAAASEKTGLVLGAHGCGLTVASGKPLESLVDPQMLGGTLCAQEAQAAQEP